jgi:hypothetical protein
MRYRVLRIAIVIAWPAIAAAQTPPRSPQAAPAAGRQTSGGTIRGHVLALDTGRPLRSARVQISAAELTAPRATMTDLDGAYEFKNLSSGRYTVTASRSSYVELSYGQTRAFEAGKPIVLGDTQTIENVDLRLPKGGAIAGTVLDDTGQPLIGATVTVLKPQFVRGIRRLISTGTARANDVGEYRVFGLSPGTFVVSAAKAILASPDWTIQTGTGYAPTFFPGSPDAASAILVAVKQGQTTGAIDFVLDAKRVGSIGGAVTMTDGRPAGFPATEPMIRRIGDPISRFTTMVMSGDGVHSNFRASGLSPGDYEIRLMPLTSSTAAVPVVWQGLIKRITLDGENLTFNLPLQPWPTATGRITIDPLASASAPSGPIRVAAINVDPADTPPLSTPAATVSADMTFTVNTAPGRMLIRPTLPKGWALKAVRLKREDVTDSGIEFASNGERVSEIEVEITDRITDITGTARNAKGDLLNDYSIIVFPHEPAHYGDSRYFATARPDQNGRFSVSGLAPGDYHVIAFDYLDPGTAQDPSLLDHLRSDATSISLREGESKSVGVKVVP